MRKWISIFAVCAAIGGGSVAETLAKPVEFSFEPLAPTKVAAFEREVWAEVVTPSGRTLRLPAFYAGDGRFAVRARADEAGEYRLGGITETGVEGVRALECQVRGERRRQVPKEAVENLPQVRIEGAAPGRFVTGDGREFSPLGANLAWAEDADRVGWYARALREFHAAGLNWTRVWMAHWGGLDLSWLPKELEPSPRAGELDERIARNWDAVLAAAEESRVYVQLVLQHHGQVSSKVNPNWENNPWNAAKPGGFLRTAGEFFTSAEAKRLTKQKYRTIVARWGYSPAIMAWELFNEVHWVDALRIDHDEAAVAQWHDEMAAYLRSLDVYGHLVTTSTEDLASPIYAAMDYYQPHLYPLNPIPAARRHDAPPAGRERPVFYGEQGDDNLAFTPEQRDSAIEAAPMMWASLMGPGGYAAQPWEGGQILAKGRLGELRAVARFVAATRLPEREGLAAFSPRIEGEPMVPLVVEPAENWRKRAPQVLRLATDGTVPLDQGTMPGILVGAPESIAEGYADRVTLRMSFETPRRGVLRIADVGAKGAAARVEIDGVALAEAELPAGGTAELAVDLRAGEHAVTIRNPGGKDWFRVGGLDLGTQVPDLAAIGRRSADFVAVWLWRRTAVLSLAEPKAVAGTLVLDDLPAGEWRVTWWDSVVGTVTREATLRHAGGGLKLPTPPVGRHAALVLTR